ncbi:MAG: metallopeptidase family protein [Candidatus Manganitrophaceae bacterium]
MTRKEFEKRVREAIDRLPTEFQSAMRNIAIIVEDRPGPEAEGVLDEDSEELLYGLYVGVPLPGRTSDDSGTLPDRIYLYRQPLEEDFPDREELLREIEITLVHEIGHFLGFDEETLSQYGYN